MAQVPKDTRSGSGESSKERLWFEEMPVRWWVSECTNCERFVLTDKKSVFGKCPICIYGLLHFRIAVDAKFKEVEYLSDTEEDLKLEQALDEDEQQKI